MREADEKDTYQALLDVIQKNARRPYTEYELHEAARNLIGFGKIALAVARRRARAEKLKALIEKHRLKIGQRK